MAFVGFIGEQLKKLEGFGSEVAHVVVQLNRVLEIDGPQIKINLDLKPGGDTYVCFDKSVPKISFVLGGTEKAYIDGTGIH